MKNEISDKYMYDSKLIVLQIKNEKIINLIAFWTSIFVSFNFELLSNLKLYLLDVLMIFLIYKKNYSRVKLFALKKIKLFTKGLISNGD